MPLRPLSIGLSRYRREPVRGAVSKLGLPWDAYYVLTKAEARLTNSKLHPNTGAPNYNVTHAVANITDIDTTYLKIDGSNADQEIDIGSQNLTTTGIGTFGTAEIDATIDHDIYDSSDDLVIRNQNQDKDIIFNVNDGGTAKDFVTIDSSRPSLLLAAGSYALPAGQGILKITGTDTATGVASTSMYFDLTKTGTGYTYISWGDLDINRTGVSAATARVYYAGLRDNSASAQANHNKEAFYTDIYPMTNTITAGDFIDRGLYVNIQGGVLGGLTTSTTTDYDIIGAHLNRGTMNVIDFGLGAAWPTLDMIGLKLTGWGQTGTETAVTTVSRYAIHSDGGDVELTDGDLTTTGDVNGGTVSEGGNQLVPAGSLSMWAGTIATIPTGWLFCDGTAVSRTTYSDLFTAIGTIYGVGDGSTTFNLPDFRDKFVVGAKQDDSGVPKTNVTGSLTQSGGAANHTHSFTGGGHTHSFTGSGHDHNISDNTGAPNEAGVYVQSGAGGDINDTNHTHSIDVTTDSAAATGTTDSESVTGTTGNQSDLPPYHAITFIIKT